MTERILLTGPVAITTRDGARFVCDREEIPSPCLPGEDELATTEARWVFTATDGTRYVGPPASAASHLESLTRLVNDWWEALRSRPQ